MSAPGTRILFSLGARLHMSAAQVERLSTRELVAWVEFFSAPEPEADDALDPRTLSRTQLRTMFRHDR
jgi:hypothetical protein